MTLKKVDNPNWCWNCDREHLGTDEVVVVDDHDEYYGHFIRIEQGQEMILVVDDGESSRELAARIAAMLRSSETV